MIYDRCRARYASTLLLIICRRRLESMRVSRDVSVWRSAVRLCRSIITLGFQRDLAFRWHSSHSSTIEMMIALMHVDNVSVAKQHFRYPLMCVVNVF